MLSRGVRIQLVVFAIIAVLSIVIAGLYYAQIPRLLGIGRFSVTATFTDASGLYKSALVSQNGVDIGLVTSVSLTPDGAKVAMNIDDGRHIPVSAHASIHSTSALGEQYVDFTDSNDNGPYLHDGSAVPQLQTTGLPSSAELLDSVDNLLKSIPDATLTRVLDEFNTAFNNTGAELSHLITSGDSFIQTANANLGPTVQLLTLAQPFLTTQLALNTDTSRYVSNLAGFTDQLVRSRSDIGSILDRTQGFTDQVNGLTSDIGPTLPTLLGNVTTIGGILRTYLPNLQETLVLLPPTISSVEAAVEYPTNPPGTAHLSFKANILNPPSCTQGYLPVSQRRDPSDVSTIATPPGLYCNVPHNSQLDVRGSHNELCAGEYPTRAASPELCDIAAGRKPSITPPAKDTISNAAKNGDSPTADYVPASSSGVTPASTSAAASGGSQTSTTNSVVPYDPATGRFQAPDGKFYILGDGTAPGTTAPKTWQQLLLATIGR